MQKVPKETEGALREQKVVSREENVTLPKKRRNCSYTYSSQNQQVFSEGDQELQVSG